ncbi:MAG: OmpA family protein [bacterium]|nr:OmpA family protein [bacterium]
MKKSIFLPVRCPPAIRFILFLLFLAPHTLWTQEIKEIKIKNAYLELFVDRSEAHFILKSIKPRDTFLTYNGKVPSTSFATIRINGTDHVYGSSQGRFTIPPKKLDDSTILSEWKIGSVYVKQILMLTGSPYSINNGDTLKVMYKILNKGSDRPQIGLRFTLDTFLGENDGVPFFMPGIGRITGYRNLYRDDLPPYGYTVGTDKDINIKFQISFPEEKEKKPDEVIMASWELFKDNFWKIPEIKKDSFKKDILSINDSSISFYWLAKPYTEEMERNYEFYYGLYHGEEYSVRDMDFILSMPDKTGIAPFFINLNCKNNSKFPFQKIRVKVHSSADGQFTYLTENEMQTSDVKPQASRDFSFKLIPNENASGTHQFVIHTYSYIFNNVITNTLVKNLTVINQKPVVLRMDRYFSPNQDGSCDDLNISIQGDIMDRFLVINNSLQERVKTVYFPSNVNLFSWSGRDEINGQAPDGLYYISISNDAMGREENVSRPGEAVLDTTPPRLSLDLTNTVINLRVMTNLVLRPGLFDTNGIKILELKIYSSNRDFYYQNLITPVEDQTVFSWNFKDNNGIYVIPDENYMVRLSAEDNACNIGRTSNLIYLYEKEPEPVKFSDINFKFNSSALQKEYYPVLDSLVKRINNNEINNLILIGHTDNIGTERYNKSLSEKRAHSVRNYLLKRIDKKFKDIISIGKGYQSPKADNTTKEGRQINRRVEILTK